MPARPSNPPDCQLAHFDMGFSCCAGEGYTGGPAAGLATGRAKTTDGRGAPWGSLAHVAAGAPLPRRSACSGAPRGLDDQTDHLARRLRQNTAGVACWRARIDARAAPGSIRPPGRLRRIVGRVHAFPSPSLRTRGPDHRHDALPGPLGQRGPPGDHFRQVGVGQAGAGLRARRGGVPCANCTGFCTAFAGKPRKTRRFRGRFDTAILHSKAPT